MRLILAALAACALSSPYVAQAGVRMHVPHKRHHPPEKDKATDAPPVSDIPEPVWTPRPRS